MPAFCRLDRIDVADNIGNRYVGRGEFFDEAGIAFYPVDFRFVAVKFDLLATVSRERLKRIIVDFRTGDNRHFVVQQFR